MPVNADIIAETLPRVLADQARFHDLYYGLLKEISPEIDARLDDNERFKISTMFYTCLETFLMLHDKPELMEEELRAINRRLANIGMQPDVQLYLKEALLQALEQFLGDEWTREKEAAWDETIGMLYTIITDVYEETVRYASEAADQTSNNH